MLCLQHSLHQHYYCSGMGKMELSGVQSVGSSAELEVALDGNTLEEFRQKARKSLYFFAKFVLGYKDMVPHVHRPLCKFLEDKSKRRLRFILPRGWFKTTLCSIAYPLWEAINDSNIRVLIAQNTATNAVSKLSSIKAVVETNKLFRALFPEILPDATCRWSSESLFLKRTAVWPEGTFEAVGIKTQVTSRHYDIIIEDDTVAPDLDELGVENICPTKEDIEKAIGWHRLVTPLLVHPRDSRNLVVGTRWFEVDLLSWIEKNEKGFFSYCRACRETNGLPDPDGEITFPERFDTDTLQEIKDKMGPYMYSCLYLNTPMSSDDMVFKKQWFQYYYTEPRDLLKFITVDLANDPKNAKNPGKRKNDYNVVMTCGQNLVDGKVYVLDYWRARTNPSEVINKIFEQVRKWVPMKVGIESIAYQEMLQHFIDQRKRSEGLFFWVEGITHGNVSKEWRIRGLQPYFRTGKILVRPWMGELLSELEVFPLGANDDLADTLSMQIQFWQFVISKRLSDGDEDAADPMSLEGAIHSLKQQRAEESKKNSAYLLDTLIVQKDEVMRREAGVTGMGRGGAFDQVFNLMRSI